MTRSVAEYNPIIQELIWISRQLENESNTGGQNLRERNKIPPSLITLTCDIHGIGYFYLADLCCVQCEMNVYIKKQEQEEQEQEQEQEQEAQKEEENR